MPALIRFETFSPSPSVTVCTRGQQRIRSHAKKTPTSADTGVFGYSSTNTKPQHSDATAVYLTIAVSHEPLFSPVWFSSQAFALIFARMVFDPCCIERQPARNLILPTVLLAAPFVQIPPSPATNRQTRPQTTDSSFSYQLLPHISMIPIYPHIMPFFAQCVQCAVTPAVFCLPPTDSSSTIYSRRQVTDFKPF